MADKTPEPRKGMPDPQLGEADLARQEEVRNAARSLLAGVRRKRAGEWLEEPGLSDPRRK